MEALRAANLSGVTTNAVLAAQADFKEGFMKQRTDSVRWDVQGMSRLAQTQRLGKVGLDVVHGWHLDHRSWYLLLLLDLPAVPKAAKVPTSKCPTSPPISTAQTQPVIALDTPTKFWILLQHFPFRELTHGDVRYLFPQVILLKQHHVPELRQMRARPAHNVQINGFDLQDTPNSPMCKALWCCSLCCNPKYSQALGKA